MIFLVTSKATLIQDTKLSSLLLNTAFATHSGMQREIENCSQVIYRGKVTGVQWTADNTILLNAGKHFNFHFDAVTSITTHFHGALCRVMYLPHSLPLQARTSPYGSRRLILHEFLDNRHMKVLRLSALPTGRPYPPPRIHPSYSFLLQTEATPGLSP
jgi:hypothetical protein